MVDLKICREKCDGQCHLKRIHFIEQNINVSEKLIIDKIWHIYCVLAQKVKVPEI